MKKRKWTQGRARQVEEKRGCSSFTGCISKGARVRCLRLINSDAARCTFKSPYILGYVLDGWMDGQARYKDRIAYPTGYRVLREVKWCGIDSLCVCTTCVCARIEIVIRAPAIKISPFNVPPVFLALISISIRVWYPRFPPIPWNSRFSALPTIPAFRED